MIDFGIVYFTTYYEIFWNCNQLVVFEHKIQLNEKFWYF